MSYSYIIKEDSNLFGKKIIVECYSDKKLVNYISMGTIFKDRVPEMYTKAIDAIIKAADWSPTPIKTCGALSRFDACSLLSVGA